MPKQKEEKAKARLHNQVYHAKSGKTINSIS